MKAAIAIDDYKLDTFKRILDEAGFGYEVHPGVTSGTLTLAVVTDDADGLTEAVIKANNESSRDKQ